MRGFHITRAKDVPSILASGLEPRIGPRSRRVCEFIPAVFLFKDRNSIEDGVMNWLGDFFKEDEPLAILEINIPSEYTLADSPHSWEIKLYDLIPPQYITLTDVVL